MRHALTATCITTMATLLAAEARAAGTKLARELKADTTVSSATTAPLATASAGNITIASGGSISPTASGAAVTINSSNTVTNSGKISFTGVNSAIGILANGGVTGSITNSGTIGVDETYTRTDSNGDGVLDGAYAQGSDRYGIRIDGTAPFTGSINSTGAITVRGNNSAGISVAPTLNGGLTINTAGVTVTGDNSVGVRLGAVTGNVALSSSISMLGGNSAGLVLGGNVGGQVVVHGSITTTGYGSTTLPSDVTKLTAQNLQQGGSAMIVGGNVAGGVLIAAAPTDTSNTTADVDKDGIADAGQATAAFVTYGAAPSLLVGSSTTATTLGVFQGNTNGLIINGKIAGAGVYAGVSATGAQIGGLGQAVTISGGIAIGGNIQGNANGAAGIGLRLGAGASTPRLTIGGTVQGAATATAGGTSVGVQIDSGATLPAIVVTGGISATTTASTGLSTAILDRSNTLNSVTNNGAIVAASTDGTGRAIDVSGRTTAFTYTQALSGSTQTTTPALAGAILTGSGNDTIAVSAGGINSKMILGAGNDTITLSGNANAAIDAMLGDGDDAVTVSGTATYSGPVDFGAGNNALTVNNGAGFFGKITNGNANLAVAVNGGTLAFNTTDRSTMGRLTVAGGTLGVVLDPVSGKHSLIDVTGATVISAPTTLKVSVSSFGVTAAPVTVLQSGTLAGSNNLTLTIDGLPYLLKGTLAASDAAGTVGVGIQRKTAGEIGLRSSEAAAYDAVFAAILGNSQLAGQFLNFTDQRATLLRYREMLPDYQGGVFDVLTQGARTLAPTQAATPWAQLGHVSLWAQQGIWDEHQDADRTAGNGGTGWGLTGGGDVAIGDSSRVGLSIGYVHGSVRDSGDNEVDANQFGGGVHWLSDFGKLHVAAYGTAGYVRFKEKRFFSGETDTSAAIFTSAGRWNGVNLAAGGKASYEAKLGAFHLRPSAELSYNRLSEDSHDETGGGTAFDLSVAKRTSDELAATGLVAAGFHVGNATDPEATTLRLELEGGRRQILSSNLDGTTAHFTGGNDFTLVPEDRKSGWLGGVTASLGSSSFRFIAAAQAETRTNGQRIVTGRFGFRGSF